MTKFTIRTVNSKFVADTELEGIETTENALAIGVRGAVAIVADDIHEGRSCASVMVTVSASGQPVLAAAVSLSVAPLSVEGAATWPTDPSGAERPGPDR